MKNLAELIFSFFCASLFLFASNSQTKPERIQPLPYFDTDGYEVLSAIIDDYGLLTAGLQSGALPFCLS